MQTRFDDGFKKGITIGRACGSFYAACRENCSADLITLKKIEDILFQTIPENNGVINGKIISDLEQILNIFSETTNNLQLLSCFAQFKEIIIH